MLTDMTKWIFSLFLIFSLIQIPAVSGLTIQELLHHEFEGKSHLIYTYGLKRHKDDPERWRLEALSKKALSAVEALPSEKDKQHYRLKLAYYAYDAGLTDFASEQAKLCLQDLRSTSRLVDVALKFQKHGMGYYGREAALKAVKCMKRPEDDYALYQLRTLLGEIRENDVLERVLLRIASQENRCFIRLSELHGELYSIGRDGAAKRVAQKAMRVIEEEFPHGAGWYHHVAYEMFKRGARDHARLLMDRAFRQDNLKWLFGMDWLVGHIVSAERMGFTDLANKGRKAYATFFSERTSLNRLVSRLPKVLEKKEFVVARTICLKVLASPFEFIGFSDGITLIDLLHKNGGDSLARKFFEKIKNSCIPTEIFTLFVGGEGIGALTPTQALVFLAHLADEYRWMEEVEMCAQASAASVLHYPFFESCDHFMGTLDWVAGNLLRLGYEDEELKVRNYLREAQAPLPRPSLEARPPVGQIIWYEHTGAKGAQIKKKRPWLIVAHPTTYGRQQVVRIVPMSSKEKPEVPRMVLFADGVSTSGEPVHVSHQELRFDQIQTISPKDILGNFGRLAPHETTRAILLLKNSF